MEFEPITKPECSLRAAPNLADYARDRAAFSWSAARQSLAGLPGGGLNIAWECVGRHVEAGHGARVALRFLAADRPAEELTFDALSQATARMAGALVALGVARGERVATLLGRVPALYVTALAALRIGAAYLPLFSAFGPEPVKARLALGSARVLVTTEALYRRKVAPIRASLPGLRHVLLLRSSQAGALPPGTLDFACAVADAAPAPYACTGPEDLALLHFTSGTTGKPKGVMHVHDAITAHLATARSVLDLHDDDVFWCTADPGWVTGISYGLIGPLACGVKTVVDCEEFDAQRWYHLLAEERVTVWYTAPTAIRMLMKAGMEAARAHVYPALRHLVSVGEPLNPEAVVWGREALGLPFHDTWWQTETGAIMVANFPAMTIRPGSMGKPVPGVEIAIVRRAPNGSVSELAAGEVGELALKPGWPAMFRGYLDDEARYEACFAGGWYLSGDMARRDVDGYVWFVGRSDDVIKAAGHLISPFEVESALMQHASVAQAGVIGIPDPVAGASVKAFVELKPGQQPSEALRRELMAHARRLLGAAVAPRQIDFADCLPRTRSGKIMRRLLKARELGLPEGDLSTLEGAA